MAETLTTQACVHHWVLAHPEDEVIRGRCKRCGATREYPATVEGASRQGLYEEAASLKGNGASNSAGSGVGAAGRPY
jgi:hypothetical protein